MTAADVVDRVLLDPWDELFHSIHTQHQGTGAGAVVLQVCGLIEREPLRAALASLQARHPKLHARIVESTDGRHAFEIVREQWPIPFELKDVEGGDFPWREESSRLLGARFDPATDPLVSVVALRAPTQNRSVLILMAHHAVGDGQSVMRLVDDLLANYAETERGGSTPPATIPIAAIPHARPSGAAWRRLLQTLALVRRRRENRKADWTWLPKATSVDQPPMWDHFVLTEQDTMALARRCRSEHSALYGALYAAAARGLMAALEQPTARFKCRFPLDIRSELTSASGPITEHHLGNYISGFEAVYDVENRSPFWALAQRVRRDMDSFKASGGPALVYNFIRFIKLPFTPPTLRRGTIMVNSYGVVDLRERYGSLSVQELSVVFNNISAGPSVLIQGFVIRKRLNLSLSMVDVPDSFWTQVRMAVRNEIQEAIQGRTA